MLLFFSFLNIYFESVNSIFKFPDIPVYAELRQNAGQDQNQDFFSPNFHFAKLYDRKRRRKTLDSQIEREREMIHSISNHFFTTELMTHLYPVCFFPFIFI